MGIMIWVRGARPKTLPLSLVPVCIGATLSWPGVFRYSQGGTASHSPCPMFGGQRDLGSESVGICATSVGWYVAVTLLCAGVALFVQIATNFANDYSDGIRGTDEGRDARQPEGASPARLVASGVPPKQVLTAAAISALLACICGLLVVALTGYWWFIGVGFACLAAGWFYVGGKHPYGYRYMGEPFVFVFFGLAATCGTMYALSGTVSLSGLWGGTAAGLLAMAVLCVNNLRDLESDMKHGKRTWMGFMGRSIGTWFAVALMLAAPTLATLYCHLLYPTQWAGAPHNTGEQEIAWNVLISTLTMAVFIILWVLCVAAAIAIRRKKYADAFPLCISSAVALAAAFACSSMFM
ncbi:1,4-dihydroxy-2-naphthoate octaprenyltransferase [Bifidobacterium panos]|uniref:1,4-dihydroxy-2-naphthoate octaprenyltransferase n=1 Tax=Bifidobacterium panos TaxID=2675321 RepID=A0ABX1SWR1_9BIFI|nr:1,4-dihydroxy-2-naphthoate octaprenyltransferase [Bifidobacterium sp. DSM 109963]NMN02270.1 1,4-dihydroxy-2-naphthoate octaprenyltransferase [Bifidobacterium sp. DSM 109963]